MIYYRNTNMAAKLEHWIIRLIVVKHLQKAHKFHSLCYNRCIIFSGSNDFHQYYFTDSIMAKCNKIKEAQADFLNLFQTFVATLVSKESIHFSQTLVKCYS